MSRWINTTQGVIFDLHSCSPLGHWANQPKQHSVIRAWNNYLILGDAATVQQKIWSNRIFTRCGYECSLSHVGFNERAFNSSCARVSRSDTYDSLRHRVVQNCSSVLFPRKCQNRFIPQTKRDRSRMWKVGRHYQGVITPLYPPWN